MDHYHPVQLCITAAHGPDALPRLNVLQTGIEKLNNLAVLYCSNNKLTTFDDLAALPKLPALKELLLMGNPLYKEWADKGETAQYRIEVRRMPHD